MNLNTALKELGDPSETVPADVMRWCAANWENVAPAARQVLARFAKNPEDGPDRDASAAFFLLHIAAQMKDASFLPLFRTLSTKSEALDVMGGLTLQVTLTPLLISLYSAEPGGLVALIDDPDTDDVVRGSAFEAIAYHTAAGSLPRATALARLKDFYEENGFDELIASGAADMDEEELMQLPEDIIGWAQAVTLLAEPELLGKLEQLSRSRALFPLIGEWEDIERVAQIAREEGEGLGAFDAEHIVPLTDAVEEIERAVEALEDEDFDDVEEGGEPNGAYREDAEDFPGATQETVRNPYRDVGRNDPCPCGSGLKFKKCHGKAEEEA